MVKYFIASLIMLASVVGFAKPLNPKVIQMMDYKLYKVERTLRKEQGFRGPDFGFFTLTFDVGIGINTGGLIVATITPSLGLTWSKDPSR
jgi:hypothetical protein